MTQALKTRMDLEWNWDGSGLAATPVSPYFLPCTKLNLFAVALTPL
jgi:hypothetical protein